MQTLFETLNRDNFKCCGMEDINPGDIIMTATFTNSQKYFYKFGCEEYNMTKVGIFISKNDENFEDSMMLRYNIETKTFTFEILFKNPGTSGGFYLKKYHCD
jgi:hypothetical protein